MTLEERVAIIEERTRLMKETLSEVRKDVRSLLLFRAAILAQAAVVSGFVAITARLLWP